MCIYNTVYVCFIYMCICYIYVKNTCTVCICACVYTYISIHIYMCMCVPSRRSFQLRLSLISLLMFVYTHIYCNDYLSLTVVICSFNKVVRSGRIQILFINKTLHAHTQNTTHIHTCTHAVSCAYMYM